MLRGLYNLAGAMETASRNQEIVSENLVHATTPGYRRQGLLFELNGTTPGADAQSAPPALRSTSAFGYFDPGSLTQTGNPLDVAVSGDAYFVVNGPNGPLYTRNGSFQLGANGEIQTRSGQYRVLGQGGALTIPPGTNDIVVASDGTITANGAEIGRLRLARIDDPSSMRRVGTTLFEADNAQTPPADSVHVEQGYREGSNVQPVQEMVAMVMGMRYYEAAQKVMQTMSDALAQNTKPQS
jgi:flagellar basal body rod protein FlgG